MFVLFQLIQNILKPPFFKLENLKFNRYLQERRQDFILMGANNFRRLGLTISGEAATPYSFSYKLFISIIEIIGIVRY